MAERDGTEVGAPPKYTDSEIADIAKDFQEYIENTDDPTVVGFTSSYSRYDVRKTYMSERQEFANLVKRAVEKQEAFLLEGAIRNSLNPTFAIFRLKQPQHGYRDRVEQDVTSGGDKIAPLLVSFMDGQSADTSASD